MKRDVCASCSIIMQCGITEGLPSAEAAEAENSRASARSLSGLVTKSLLAGGGQRVSEELELQLRRSSAHEVPTLHTNRQTDRQTDRRTDGQTVSQSDGQT